MKRIFTLLFVLTIILFSTTTKAQIIFYDSSVSPASIQEFCISATEIVSVKVAEKLTGSTQFYFTENSTDNTLTIKLDNTKDFTFGNNTDATANELTITTNGNNSDPTDITITKIEYSLKIITITFDHSTSTEDDIVFGNIILNAPIEHNDDEVNLTIENSCLYSSASLVTDKTIKLTSSAPSLNITGDYYFNTSGMEVSFGGSSSCNSLILQKKNGATWDKIVDPFDYATSKATLNIDDQVRLITGAGRYSPTITLGNSKITKPVFTNPDDGLTITKPCWSDVIALKTSYDYKPNGSIPDEYRLYLNGTITPILTIDPDDLEATLDYTPTADGTLRFSAYFTDGPEIFSDPPLTISGLIESPGTFTLKSGDALPYSQGKIALTEYFTSAPPDTTSETTDMEIDFGDGNGTQEYDVFGNADGFYKFILPYESATANNTATFDTKAVGVYYNFGIPNTVKFYYGVVESESGKVCYQEEQTNIVVIRDKIFVPAQSFCSTDDNDYTIIIDKEFGEFNAVLEPNYSQIITFENFEFSIDDEPIDPDLYEVEGDNNEKIRFKPSNINLNGEDQVLIDFKASLKIVTSITTGVAGVYPAWGPFTDYDEGDNVQYNGNWYTAKEDIPIELYILPFETRSNQQTTRVEPIGDEPIIREIYPVPTSSFYWYDHGPYNPGGSTLPVGTLVYEYATNSFYIFKTKEDGSLNLKTAYCKSENEIELIEPHGYTVDSIMKRNSNTLHAVTKDAGKWEFKPEDFIAIDDGFETIEWDLYYTDDRGCVVSAVPIEFDIDETVDFTHGEANLGLDPDYCPENKEIILKESSVINNLIGNVEVFNGVTATEITDKQFNPSEFWDTGDPSQTLEFSFNYRHDNGCAYNDNFEVTINPIPTINYIVDNECFGNAIEFIGTTSYSNTVEDLIWEWDFDDNTSLIDTSTAPNVTPVPDNTHNGNTTGTYVQPIHMYSNAGEYNASLKVSSANGCATDSIFEIIVGSYPIVSFNPTGFVENGTTSFENLSEAELFDPVDSVAWDFDDPASPNDTLDQNAIQSATYKFETTGVHDVALTMITKTGCESSDTVKVPIFPKEIVTTDNTYVAIFDDINLGWLSSDEFDKGLPSGWKLKTVASPFNISNTEGRIWQTGDPADNITNEKSWVESPCFDISGLDFPLLSMDIYQSVEAGRDGAALQYTLNDGKTWKLLGDEGVGVNWYDTRGIVSNPGSQTQTIGVGWSLDEKEWKTARYTLDDLKQEIIDSSASFVRFRVAYSSDAGNAPGLETQGFAFDNFTLAKRKRSVLIEQFVNSVQDKTLQENEETWLNAFLVGKTAEVVDMRYHNFISHDIDPLFNINPPDISSRSMEYGATMAQLTMIDGVYRCLANSEVEAKSYYKERSLTDIAFDIDNVTHIVNGDNLEISADITKLKEDLLTPGSDKCVVRMAIVQHAYEYNEETYKNVVVELLPNGEGNVVATIPADFAQYETMTVTGTWTPNVTTIGNEFRLVVYVQGIWGVDEIHQVWFEDSIAVPDNTAKTALETEKSGSSNSFTIYPSPVKEKLNINWYETLENPVRWKLVSMSGTVVKEGTTAAGEIHQEIETYQLNKGIYLLLTEDLSSLEVDQHKILIVK